MIIYETKKYEIPAWVEQAEKTATNSKRCEICGEECNDRVTRHARKRYAEKRRTNRTRIYAGYFDNKYSWAAKLEVAGMKSWADKLACSVCFKKFTDILNNTSACKPAGRE